MYNYKSNQKYTYYYVTPVTRHVKIVLFTQNMPVHTLEPISLSVLLCY